MQIRSWSSAPEQEQMHTTHRHSAIDVLHQCQKRHDHRAPDHQHEVGELTLEEAYARMEEDIANQMAESDR